MVDEKNEDVNESFGNDDDIDEVDQKATAGGKAEAKANGATAPEDDSAEDVSEKALAIPLNTLSKAQLKVFMESHWLVTIGNKVAVAYWGKDDGGEDELRTIGTADFDKFYADTQIEYAHKIKVPLDDGKFEWKTEKRKYLLSEYFRKKAARLHGLTMRAVDQPIHGRKLNLWRGFGIKPRQGSWERIRKHIYEVLAGSNHEIAEYIIRWIAWVVQNPTKQAEVVIVFMGGQGAGKGVICRLVRSFFGIHGLQVFDKDDLVGKFTKHLAWCCFLFADEAFFAGDPSIKGKLKGMITEPEMMVEFKHIDKTKMINRLSFMMASNQKLAIPAEHDERRYMASNVSSRYKDNFEYFKELYGEIEHGGAAAMLHDLLKMDLQGWHPRQSVPDTEALREQKVRAMKGLDSVVYTICNEGRLPCAMLKFPDRALTTGSRNGTGFLGYIRSSEAVLRRHSNNDNTLIEDLRKDWGCKPGKGGGKNWLEFPPLSELRRKFNEKYGDQDWGEGWESEEWLEVHSKGFMPEDE